jgi:hypothetical protein
VSVSTVQRPPPVASEAAGPSAGAHRSPQSTAWRLYAVLAFGSLLLGSLSLLYPSTPSYDPWGWLLWGREIIHLQLNTLGANTFKPLPVLLTAPFALFGKAQPDLWLAVARAGALFAVAMAFRLAARIAIWCGATPAGRQGVSRLIAYGPAVLAGGIAALGLLISPGYVSDAALGYSECLGAGLVLLAIDRHLDGKHRQAFIIGFFPALDRPEIWAFWGLYGLYLWRRDPEARKLIALLFALVPILWFGPELWGSGHLFRGVTRALHPRSNAPTFTKCPFCTEMKAASELSLSRVKIVAGAMVVGAAITAWHALRGRKSGLRTAVRAQAHRPEGIVLVLAAMASLWFVEISAMTQLGFSGNQRYLIIGGALVIILGGIGYGLVAWKLAELLGRRIRSTSGAAVALATVTVGFLFLPGWVGQHFKAHMLADTLRYQADLRQDLSAIVSRAGGASKLVACGKVETENFQVPMVAWYLGIDSVDVSGELPLAVTNRTGPRAPNVILQTRETASAALRPLIPSSVPYTKMTQRTFRLYEHCA